MEFYRIDPGRDLGRLREFLAASDPEDYLLEEIDEWIRNGRLWAGVEDGTWVAFGRFHDLGEGEGWLSGLRVRSGRRREGLGSRLVRHLLDDARSVGVREVRAVIENENLPSRRLFERLGFVAPVEMTLRCGTARVAPALELHRAGPAARLPGPVGWLPERTGRSDLMPDADGGRFGRWRPSLVERWAREGKLYLAAGTAVAVQPDWWKDPRTLWVNPLVGDAASMFPALDALAAALHQEEWQAFLPSGEGPRQLYERLGTRPHPFWGDRVQLYEGKTAPTA